MKRTKEWWAALEEGERSMIVNMERYKFSQSSYFPDDCVECICGNPVQFGFCDMCQQEYDSVIEKASRQ